MEDIKFMKQAIKEALKAQTKDEVPIGAVLVKDGKIVARAHNTKEKTNLPISHAEINVITKYSKKINNWRLEDTTLYVTLEPCSMCAGAIINSRIKRVVYGAYDPKGGAFGTLYDMSKIQGFNHYPIIEGGVIEEECSLILKEYFKGKRKNKNNEVK